MAWMEPNMKSFAGNGAEGEATTLFEGFAICGLTVPLCINSGDDAGLKGRYKPGLIQHLFVAGRSPPLQLATCCMPDGVEVVPVVKAGSGRHSVEMAPALYSLVLTDEGGRRLYVSCLTYLDAVPPTITCRHAHLVGALATRTLCLVSRLPYLATAEQVLRRLYSSVFCLGPSGPVGDLVGALLRLPSPAVLQREVQFHLEGRPFLALPPDATGAPRGGEVSLRPLLEALSPANVMLTFMAVLLERRVVLTSSQLRLPTLAGEALLQLLWPIRYQHVYVPLVPSSLLDLLDAPTPFLMGLGGRAGAAFAAEQMLAEAGAAAGGGGDSGQAAPLHDGLVVVDLDRNCVSHCEDLRPCLEHPAAVQLLACLAALRPFDECQRAGPSAIDGLPTRRAASAHSLGMFGSRFSGRRSGSTTGGSAAVPEFDPWMPYVRTAALLRGWSPTHDALVRRLFLRLFSTLLRGYHEHLPATAAAAATAAASAGGTTETADERGAADSAAAPRFSPSAPPFRTETFLQRHCKALGPQARPLAAQLVQTQGFFVLADEYGGRDPYEWYRTASTAYRSALAELLGDDDGDSGSSRREGDPAAVDPTATSAGPAVAAVLEPETVILIGTPASDDASMPEARADEAPAPRPPSSPPRVVSYCRPCPLLRRRKAPVYRSFPSLHVSDQPYADIGGGSDGAIVGAVAHTSVLWQGWQCHVMGSSLVGCGAGGGGGDGGCPSCGDARGGGGGGVGGGVTSVSRKRPLRGSRRNRSLSGSISGDMATALASELARPRHRISSCDVPMPHGGAASACTTAAPSGAGGDAATSASQSASSPALSDLPHVHAHARSHVSPQTHGHAASQGHPLRNAAATVAAEAASITASFSSTLTSISHSLRVVGRKAAVTAAASPAAAAAAAAAAANTAAAAAAAAAAAPGHAGNGHGGQGHGCTAGSHHVGSHGVPASQLANYVAEQELLRQQIAALLQLLSWGHAANPEEVAAAAAAGAASAAAPGVQSAAAAAAAAAVLRPGAAAAQGGLLPDEAEVERVRTLLCLQAGGNGAFLVGRLREEVGASAAAATPHGATHSPALPAGASHNSGRILHQAAFGVLVDAFDALVTAAVQHQDFGVLADALELSVKLHTFIGPGTSTRAKVRVLHSLSANPYLYTRYVWAGMFAHSLRSLAVAAAATAPSDGGAAAAAEAAAAAAAAAAAPDHGTAAVSHGTDGGTGDGAGGASAALPAGEALRRQRVLLRGLRRLLVSQASWLMHLGVLEEAAWELLAGLVAASGVAALPAAKEGNLLLHIMLSVRSTLRSARSDAFPPHRRRTLLQPGCCGLQPQPGSPPHRWPVPTGGVSLAGATGFRCVSAPSSPTRVTSVPPPPQPPLQSPERLSMGRMHTMTPTMEQSPPPPPFLHKQPASPPAVVQDSRRRCSDGGDAAVVVRTTAAAAAAATLAGKGLRASTSVLDVPTPPPDVDDSTARCPGVAQTRGPATAGRALRASTSSIADVIRSYGGDSPVAKRLRDMTSAAGGGGGAAVAGAISPNSVAGGGKRGVGSGGGVSMGGSAAGRPYSVQYERQVLSAAAAGAAAPVASPSKSPWVSQGGGAYMARRAQQPPQPQPQQQLDDSVADGAGRLGCRRGVPSAVAGPPVSEVHLGCGRPIVALAAASGVVLAAAQEPHCHILSCSETGGLRATSRLPLAHLDAAFAERLALSPDGRTAALSVAPLPPPPPRPRSGSQSTSAGPPPHREVGLSSAGGASTVTGGGGGGPAGAADAAGPGRPRALALVDVAAGRIIRELRPATRSRITALTLSPTANLLVSGCVASWARLWDARLAAGGGGGGAGRCAPVTSLATRQGGVCSLLLDSGRLRLYTGGRDGTAAEWDLRKPTCPVAMYGSHNGWVTCLELLPAGAGGGGTGSTALALQDLVTTAAASPPAAGTAGTAVAVRLTGGSNPEMPSAFGSLTPPPRPPPCLVTGSTDWTVRVWGSPTAAVAADAAGGGVGVTAAAALESADPGPSSPSTLPTPGSSCGGSCSAGGGHGATSLLPAAVAVGSEGGGSQAGRSGGGSGSAWGSGCGSSCIRSGGGGQSMPALEPASPGAAAAAPCLPLWPHASMSCQQPRAVLVGHRGAITSLHIDKEAAAGAISIYTGAQDGSLGVWSPEGRCRHLLPCHRGPITLLTAITPPAPPPPPPPPRRPPLEHVLEAEDGDFKDTGIGGKGGKLDGRCDLHRRMEESYILTSGGDGSAGLWAPTRGSLGYSPLLAHSDGCSLARLAAWDAARGVLVRGDERGVVRAWVPGAAGR